MIKIMLRNAWKKEFVRYGITGCSTTGIDLLIFFVLCEIGNFNATLSNVISLFVSLCYSYGVNKVFVFRTVTDSKKDVGKEIYKFFSSRIFTIFLELLFVYVFSEQIGLDGFISKLITQIVIFVCNYLLSKFWAFKK